MAKMLADLTLDEQIARFGEPIPARLLPAMAGVYADQRDAPPLSERDRAKAIEVAARFARGEIKFT